MASLVLSLSDAEYKLDSPSPDNTVHMKRTAISEAADVNLTDVVVHTSFMEWSDFNSWKQRREDMQDINKASKAPKRHTRFFLPAENIFFLVRIHLVH